MICKIGTRTYQWLIAGCAALVLSQFCTYAATNPPPAQVDATAPAPTNVAPIVWQVFRQTDTTTNHVVIEEILYSVGIGGDQMPVARRRTETRACTNRITEEVSPYLEDPDSPVDRVETGDHPKAIFAIHTNVVPSLREVPKNEGKGRDEQHK
jgi:hypothetical protein